MYVYNYRYGRNNSLSLLKTTFAKSIRKTQDKALKNAINNYLFF